MTVSFTLDGTEYEIYLSAKNAETLREAFAPHVKAGRKLGR
ncbi:histone-like nucleoid-structuring protein Lsr2 [Microbacterium sp. 13-71-7]